MSFEPRLAAPMAHRAGVKSHGHPQLTFFTIYAILSPESKGAHADTGIPVPSWVPVFLCIWVFLSRKRKCNLTTGTDAPLGSPSGGAGCPLRGRLRGPHGLISGAITLLRHPLSQPVRLTALPKGEPRGAAVSARQISISCSPRGIDMHKIGFLHKKRRFVTESAGKCDYRAWLAAMAATRACISFLLLA